jgi:hypothetical protein
MLNASRELYERTREIDGAMEGLSRTTSIQGGMKKIADLRAASFVSPTDGSGIIIPHLGAVALAEACRHVI